MIDDIGRKIYDLRTAQGMTLEELGKRVGVGKSTVRKWENGLIGNMRRDKVVKVAEALHTTPAYLLGWEDEVPEDPITDDDRILLRAYHHSSDGIQESVRILLGLKEEGKLSASKEA